MRPSCQNGRVWSGAMMNLLIGAALTLAAQLIIQLGVVPMVQSRARRAGRWEQAVRDLIELLNTTVSDRGSEAQALQGLYGDLLKLEAEPGQDRDRIAKIRTDNIWETRKANRAFVDLAHTRVGLHTDEILAFRPKANEIVKLEILARQYWIRVAIASSWAENDIAADIEESWKEEYRARLALIRQARFLADLRHPPRASLRCRVQRWTAVRARRAISWARTGVRWSAIGRAR
jgi:hypothetical protein